MSYHVITALNDTDADTDSEVKKSHDDLGLDEIYAILSNSRRRTAIRHIDRVGSCPFGELVDVVSEGTENRQAVYVCGDCAQNDYS